MTRIALDSNVPAYLAGVSRSTDYEEKIEEIRSLIERLSAHVTLVAPAQAMGELFVVLRRSGASPLEARSILIELADAFGTSASESTSVLAAADLCGTEIGRPLSDQTAQRWVNAPLGTGQCPNPRS